MDLVIHTESMGVLLLQQTLVCSGVAKSGRKEAIPETVTSFTHYTK